MTIFEPFEWQIGWRYTRARRGARKNRFISFISLISMLGITIGVAALIIVLSVMNGFQKEVRDRMLSVLSHIEIVDARGAMQDWNQTAQRAKQNSRVLAAAPYVSGQAMLVRDEVLRGALIRGIDPVLEPLVADFGKQLLAGRLSDLTPGSFNIVLGRELAFSLGLRLGDK
ncbi:MAG: ABC transporter permease, partial [Burkholderiales bacterium]